MVGRSKKSFVFRYFLYNEGTNTSVCTIDGCQTSIKGNHGTNLMQHVRRKHPREHTIIQEQDENTENITPNIYQEEQGPSSSNKRTKHTNLRDECVNLVTQHGRPFALLDDVAFQNIIQMIPKQQGAINSHNIKQSIIDKTELLRNRISQELRYKLLCLKMDVATCAERSFLGINCQYVKDGNIILRTLGIVELHARHTSENLKDSVMLTLHRFRIDPGQIYSVTTDNGSNMIKLTRLLQDEIVTTENDDNENEMSDVEDAIEDENVEVGAFTLEESEENVNLHGNKYTVSSVRCAAHTLQLAVDDGLAAADVQNVIALSRNLVRKLRTPTTTRVLLKLANKKKPIIDCTTRWHSTVDMLERLLSLKYCCSNEELYLDESSWIDIDVIVRSLTPCRTLTKILQTEQLTFGDFYCTWMKCQLNTEKENTPLALCIVQAMKIREKVLFENDAFLAAMYLDPKVNSVMSNEEHTKAKQHLTATWSRIEKLQRKGLPTATEDTLEHQVPDNSSSDDESSSILRRTYTARVGNTQRRQSDVDTANILRDFLKEPLLRPKENILKYWESKKLIFPQLYTMSNVVLASPATQVSVERLFSSLKFVLTSLRSNLREDIVEDILLIRNNALYNK